MGYTVFVMSHLCLPPLRRSRVGCRFFFGVVCSTVLLVGCMKAPAYSIRHSVWMFARIGRRPGVIYPRSQSCRYNKSRVTNIIVYLFVVINNKSMMRRKVLRTLRLQHDFFFFFRYKGFKFLAISLHLKVAFVQFILF